MTVTAIIILIASLAVSAGGWFVHYRYAKRFKMFLANPADKSNKFGVNDLIAMIVAKVVFIAALWYAFDVWYLYYMASWRPYDLLRIFMPVIFYAVIPVSVTIGKITAFCKAKGIE